MAGGDEISHKKSNESESLKELKRSTVMKQSCAYMIFQYLPPLDQIQMQLLSKRFYHAMTPAWDIYSFKVFMIRETKNGIDDDFGGDTVIKSNLFFKSLLETSDHGPYKCETLV